MDSKYRQVSREFVFVEQNSVQRASFNYLRLILVNKLHKISPILSAPIRKPCINKKYYILWRITSYSGKNPIRRSFPGFQIDLHNKLCFCLFSRIEFRLIRVFCVRKHTTDSILFQRYYGGKIMSNRKKGEKKEIVSIQLQTLCIVVEEMKSEKGGE